MTSVPGSLGVNGSVETGNWYPQRSDLRYGFVATTEVVDPKSGRQIVSETSNLSRYGCHVRTSTPVLPGTPVNLRIQYQGTSFQSQGRVVYAIRGEGIGIHFANVPIGERVVLKEWLLQLSTQDLENRLRERPRIRFTNKGKVVLTIFMMALGTIVICALQWFKLLR
jgi:hypothetical protein